MPKMSAGETLESALLLHCLDEHSLGYKQTFCASSEIYRVAHCSLWKTSLYNVKGTVKRVAQSRVLLQCSKRDSHKGRQQYYHVRKLGKQFNVCTVWVLLLLSSASLRLLAIIWLLYAGKFVNVHTLSVKTHTYINTAFLIQN